MEAKAKLTNCPMSARKMRLVVDNIRGKDVEAALNILKYTNKEASIWLDKLVRSAANNWMQKNEDADIDEAALYIKTAFVDNAPQVHRFRPAPQGRAAAIIKRRNHVTLVVDSRK
jgi:large subunit ribosomal protein L22